MCLSSAYWTPSTKASHLTVDWKNKASIIIIITIIIIIIIIIQMFLGQYFYSLTKGLC